MSTRKKPSQKPEVVLQQYREGIQQLVTSVMAELGNHPPGVERLCAGLQRYWDNWHEHRALRRAVVDATRGTPYENSVEPIGRPFLMMLRAELIHDGVRDADRLAQWLYDESRAIADAESRSGRRAPRRRACLLALLRAEASG